MTRGFSGEPEARWISEAAPDRNMVLLRDFWFVDDKGRRWDAPKGSVVNGASIPRPLWAALGSPYTGDYRRASIVHDVACDRAIGNDDLRRSADRMFFEACRAGGCSWWEAAILYVGVRIGSSWNKLDAVDDMRVRLGDAPGDEELRREFRQIAEEVLRQGETEDPRIVEARTDEAFTKLVAYKAELSRLARP